MPTKHVSKESPIGATLLFDGQTDEQIDRIEHSFVMSHIDIISLDALEGDPVTPTTGTYKIYARTDVDGGFKLLNEHGVFDAKKTGGSGLADGVAVGAVFIGFPREFKIVPNGVDVAVAYRVAIKQSSGQISRTTPVETSARGNVGAAVFVQDQTTPSLDLFFLQDLDTTTLDGANTRDSRFFDVAVGEGSLVTVGNIVEIGSASTFIQARVLGIVGDTLEIDSPMPSAFADLTTVVIKSDDLKVDGSVTPQVFTISPEPAQIGDIVRVILRMEGTADMDSGTFGTLPALTNGVVIRFKRSNGDFTNLINFKTNGDFVSKSFDHEFFPNNGNGVRLFVSRLSYGGQDKFGVVQRLDGDIGEELQVVIQDDLTGASLTDFEINGQGHEVQV